MPAPLTGQVTVTGAQVDPTQTGADCKAFSLKAPLSNAQPVFIGPSGVSSTTGYQLDPGDEISYERISQNGQPQYNLRPSDFFVSLTTGDRVCWLASP